MLANLLANAAKFTDPGGDIRLTAQAEAGQAVLRVRDNGRGIAPELLPRVFDSFWQGPGRGEKGARGLGLAPELRLGVTGVRTAALQSGYFVGAAVGGVALASGGYGAVGAAFAALFVAAAVPHLRPAPIEAPATPLP